MEARVAKVEAAVEHIEKDVSEIKGDIKHIMRVELRLLWGALMASSLGLAAMMAKGFKWF